MTNEDQDRKPAMTARDRRALWIGLTMGVVGGVLSIAAVYAAALVFLICSFVFPLITSLIAQNRIVTLSLVPNLVMVVVTGACLILLIVGNPSTRYGWAEVLGGAVAWILMGVIPALVVSWPIKVIRKRLSRPSGAP